MNAILRKYFSRNIVRSISLLFCLSVLGGMASQALAGAAASPADAEKDLSAYSQQIWSKIFQKVFTSKEQGRLDVKLFIERDGTVKKMEVKKLEGTAAIEGEMKKIIDGLSPFDPVPRSFDANTLVLSSSVTFSYPGQNLYDHIGTLQSENPSKKIP